MEQKERQQSARLQAARGMHVRSKDTDVLESLWVITSRGNNAEVRQREGRLIVYEVQKHIAVG